MQGELSYGSCRSQQEGDIWGGKWDEERERERERGEEEEAKRKGWGREGMRRERQHVTACDQHIRLLSFARMLESRLGARGRERERERERERKMGGVLGWEGNENDRRGASNGPTILYCFAGGFFSCGFAAREEGEACFEQVGVMGLTPRRTRERSGNGFGGRGEGRWADAGRDSEVPHRGEVEDCAAEEKAQRGGEQL